ncbi:hypothetical protein QLX67_12535 [Balneolaceae bacterium ANBcel3]|nr:hypothetical protein [Balneolaceae bacterium ANBcel3]
MSTILQVFLKKYCRAFPRTGLLVILFIVVFAMYSCSPSSQLPLSVRERGESPLAKDTIDMVESEAIDEERLRQMQEEAKINRMRRDQIIAETEAEHKERTNQALAYYSRAQEAFFSGNHRQALHLLHFGLQETESADLLALKGSVYHILGEDETAVKYWNRAVEKDEEVVCDMYPGISEWHRSLGE